MAKLLRLARPQFLIASLTLFIIGAFWAVLVGAPFSFLRMLLGYLVIMPAHLSVSFSNDYFDMETDKHGTPALFSGGSGILVENPKLRKSALWIALTLNLCSLLLGISFLVKYSYPIWFLGFVVVSNMLGWLYSAPPFRLAYRGFSELLTVFTSGFLVPGMGYLVMKGYLNGVGLFFMIPLLLYGLAFILAVEIPDMEADRLGRKNNWIARRGRKFGFLLIGLVLISATGFFFGASFFYAAKFTLDFYL
jgi:1,4-dihydroxy-2-naphthoate polyprenyltransferase